MTARTWALIANGVVENIVVWDGESAWSPPPGCTLVEVTGTATGPGWTYDGATFSPPPGAA